MEFLFVLTGGLLFASGLYCGLKLGKKQEKPHESTSLLNTEAQAMIAEDLKNAQDMKRQWDDLMAYTGRGRGGQK